MSTYGLVIPEDSPNTCVCGDEELDGFANLGASKLVDVKEVWSAWLTSFGVAENDFGDAIVNITQVGDFTGVEYEYKLTPLRSLESVVRKNAGLGKIRV